MTGLGPHVFVDENKARGYVIAAATVLPADLDPSRKVLRQLLLKGQSRLHFTKERDSRRRTILSAMCETEAKVMIDASKASNDKAGREECLQALLDDVLDLRASRLVLERDDSLAAHDRQVIAARFREEASAPEYLHTPGKNELLLWVSDAAAWCWYRGGDWKRRVLPLVHQVRDL